MRSMTRHVTRRMLIVAMADIAANTNRPVGEVIKQYRNEAVKELKKQGLPIYEDEEPTITTYSIEHLIDPTHTNPP